MKIFMFLHECPFLHVSAPTTVSLDEFGLKVTKIRAQTTDLTQNQGDLLPPPFSLPSQLEELDNHLIRYSELRNTVFKSFNNGYQRPPGVLYTHFGFDIYESPFPTCSGQGDQINMDYQLKMKMTDDRGNDWFKILRRVCGGDKVKISVSLEIRRKGVNGEILKASLGTSGMATLESKGSCFCVGPKLIAKQVEELMALIKCGAPWAVFSGKVTICLEVDEDIAIFAKQRRPSVNEGRVGRRDLSHVNLQILESGIESNVEIFPGGFGAPVKCHHNFLVFRSSVFEIILRHPARVGETKKIYMPEASEKCVHALLRYLYTGNLTWDEDENIICMELWKVAREYELVELENEIKNKLGDKSVSGFSVGLAIELFCWARNLVNDDTGRRLKEKAVLALKRKFAYELESAPEYIRLFENDPVAARDLCKCAFET